MNPAIAICVPYFGNMPMMFTQSLGAQLHSLGLDGFDRMAIFWGTASTGAFRARNGIMRDMFAAEEQLGYKYDWTIWFDSDMAFPSQTVQGLLRHEKDIIGATYKRRSPPYDLLGRPYQGQPGQTRTVSVGQLAQCDGLPTGCLLIRRKVFDSISKPIWKVDIKDGISPEGEDMLFCREAREAGYEIWLDTQLTTMVAHLAEIPLFAQAEKSSIIRPN